MQSICLKVLGTCLFVCSSINCYAQNACPRGQVSEVLCNGAYYSCGNSPTIICNGNRVSCSCADKRSQ